MRDKRIETELECIALYGKRFKGKLNDDQVAERWTRLYAETFSELYGTVKDTRRLYERVTRKACIDFYTDFIQRRRLGHSGAK